MLNKSISNLGNKSFLSRSNISGRPRFGRYKKNYLSRSRAYGFKPRFGYRSYRPRFYGYGNGRNFKSNRKNFYQSQYLPPFLRKRNLNFSRLSNSGLGFQGFQY